jgi:hypothetical protein
MGRSNRAPRCDFRNGLCAGRTGSRIESYLARCTCGGECNQQRQRLKYLFNQHFAKTHLHRED